MTMKTKLLLQTPAAIFILIVSLAAASAQPAPPTAPAFNPVTGPPVTPGASAAIDPNTGLPMAQPEPQWIDSNWQDPDIVLTNVSYDNLPVSEVAKNLRERFKNYLDILPMPSTYGEDWGNQVIIQLQLRNVGASEIFNAMNLVFENDRTPVRWELKWTGRRPIVQLRVLPEAAPQPEPPQPKAEPAHRMVFFVGNLLGDEKSGGMTMDQIIKTIYEVWPTDFGKPEGIIQFHKDAQLLVVNGTREQIDFIQQILSALRQKVNAVNSQSPLERLKSDRKTNSDDAK